MPSASRQGRSSGAAGAGAGAEATGMGAAFGEVVFFCSVGDTVGFTAT
ncbi:hypothetical protein [Streptomyces sp. NPDC055107]